MEFLQAKPSDKAAVMQLWQKDFESYEPYFSWYFNSIYRDDRTFLLKEGEQLLACLQLAPYGMSLRGQKTDIDFVVGVITEPEYRGKGIGRELMQKLSARQKQLGRAFSVLYPTAPAFYEKLDYACCYEELLCRTHIGELPECKASLTGSWREYEIAEAIAQLQGIYRQMTAARNGYIIRKNEDWQKLLEELHCDDGRIVIYNEPGGAKAYLLYFMQGHTLCLREIGFADAKYLPLCLQYLKEKFDEAVLLKFTCPPELAKLLPALKEKAEPHTGAMVICNDALAAASRLMLPQAGEVRLEVRRCDGRSERLLLSSSGCRALAPGEKTQASIKAGGFAQLLWGAKSAAELADKGWLAADAQSLTQLESIFPKQQNWLGEQT